MNGFYMLPSGGTPDETLVAHDAQKAAVVGAFDVLLDCVWIK